MWAQELKLLPGFKITERNNLAIILIYSLLETPFILTLHAQHFFLNQNNLFWVLIVNINLDILDFHFFCTFVSASFTAWTKPTSKLFWGSKWKRLSFIAEADGRMENWRQVPQIKSKPAKSSFSLPLTKESVGFFLS